LHYLDVFGHNLNLSQKRFDGLSYSRLSPVRQDVLPLGRSDMGARPQDGHEGQPQNLVIRASLCD